LVCAKHVAQSNSRSVNSLLPAPSGAVPKKPSTARLGGFFITHLIY
jgi:hypothetical protein